MSRAYRISVSERIQRVIKGSDHVGTKLELLELLPKEQMSQLLAADLKDHGFSEDSDGMLVRQDGDVTIKIDPASGDVRVSTELSQEVELKKTGHGYADTDFGRRGKQSAEKQLREQTRRELEAMADDKSEKLTDQATEMLENALRDLQKELDGVVNRVTAEALKQKAAQLGEIKSVTEDADNGSMTIILEV